MSYRINTEEYYQRFIDLQEKLRKSEEERLKLEIRLNKMMQIIQTEEQRHYDNLSLQYKQFREEDKKRQDRNNYILRILDRVQNQSEALEEKARRLSMIRDQYYGMPRRHYDDTRPSYLNSHLYDNDSYNPSPERDICSAVDLKEYNMNKNFNLQHQEKMEYLNKYLDTIDSKNAGKQNYTSNESPRSFRSSKSPTHSSNLKLDDLKPTTPDLGYKTENFLTNRYSYYNFDEDDNEDCLTSSPDESPRYVPVFRNRSKSPNPITKSKLDELGDHKVETLSYPDFNTRLSRYPRQIDRRKKQTHKKLFSTDYKNSLEKLQRIQENSRKILSQHTSNPNYHRNHENIDYDRRPILSYQNDLIWNYPVASDFGLNMNDMYQPDKVIQKYLMEKYNTYLYDKYPPHPFDPYQDKMMYNNFSPRAYNRFDYIRYLPDKHQPTSNIPNDAYTYLRSPRTYAETHVTAGNPPRFNEFDEHYSKVPSKSNYISGADNVSHRNDDLRKEEKTQGIHFNEKDQILEYDRNKPSREYNKKYELNKNWKRDDVSLNKDGKDSDINHHEEVKCMKDNDLAIAEDAVIINGNITPPSSYNTSKDGHTRSESPINQERNNNVNCSLKNTKNSAIPNMVNIPNNDNQSEVQQISDPPKDCKMPKEENKKSSNGEEIDDKMNGVGANANIKKSQNENIEQPNDIIALDNPLEINENIPCNIEANEVSKSDEVCVESENLQNQDPDSSITEYKELKIYNANDEQPILNNTEQTISYDENEQPNHKVHNGDTIQDDGNGQPIHQSKKYSDPQTGQKIQYGENGQVNQYDQNDQLINHENGQPTQFENSQPTQFESGELVQYDENGQPIQYDENGQPIPYDQNGEPIQYDETGQPIQYDENGQPIQYDQNGQPIQYDETGQPIQYDETGQPIQYDENGQPIHYDQNGQRIQYDENGQAIQYDENCMPIQYDPDEVGQSIQYDEHGQPLPESSGQQLLYDSNGQLIQYDESGQPIKYNEDSQNYNTPTEDVPKSTENAAELEEEHGSKPNVFEMLDTDTESIKQDTKVSNDSDFELTTS